MLPRSASADSEALQAAAQALREENEMLRAENGRLRTQPEDAIDERINVRATILNSAPINLYAKDLEGRYVFINRHTERLFGKPWEEIRGKTDHDIFQKEHADLFADLDRQALESGTQTFHENSMPMPDGVHHYVTTKFPLRDPKQTMLGVCSVTTDITVFKEAEASNKHLHEEVIRAQDMTLRALSTPLLPIAPGVVVMPLIGYVDPVRAQRVLDVLLDGVSANGATLVILDVTGVPIVDTEVANAIVKTARAAKLLGAKVVLTGIQPEIARTLVDLGADLTDVVTLGTLQSGIAFALKRTGASTTSAALKPTDSPLPGDGPTR